MLFRRFGDSALDFELSALVADLDTGGQVASDLRQDIDRRFRQAYCNSFRSATCMRSVEQTSTMAVLHERRSTETCARRRLARTGMPWQTVRVWWRTGRV